MPSPSARCPEGQQGRRRRDHREQRPQQNHQGPADRPGLLRQHVGATARDHCALRKAKAIEYEEYLKRIAELAARLDAGQSAQTPAELNTPAKRALYNNLTRGATASAQPGESGRADVITEHADPAAVYLALKIDEVVKTVRPDGWRGIQAREQVIKAALYGVLQDVAEVERIFLIVKAQAEY
jgi:type I restriction enzyme R subunit